MIRYVRKEFETLTKNDLRALTRKVDPKDASRIHGHYVAARKEEKRRSGAKLNGTRSGAVFEACVYDALIYFGVPSESIAMHVQPFEGENAEIDFVIERNGSGPLALHAKASMRERWAQADRASLLLAMAGREMESWLLFDQESEGQDLEAVRKLADRRERECRRSHMRVVSALDTEKVAELLRSCGANRV